MTKIPFPLKGQTTGTIRASSSFLEKNPTTTLHLQPPPSTITFFSNDMMMVDDVAGGILETIDDCSRPCFLWLLQ
ncbi:hypothetical protein Hanom_Chr03g00190381 [Helianthus anomalus]